MIMADVIISDYSSLPIDEFIRQTNIILCDDEHKYDKIRGLNQFYKAIPQQYKVTTEEELILKIRNDIALFKPLFKIGISIIVKIVFDALQNLLKDGEKMKIAIIIPVYNAEKTIRRAIKSIDTTHEVKSFA